MRPDRFDAGFHKIPICFVNMLYSGARCTNEVIFLDVRGVRSRHVCQQREKKEKVPIDRRCSLMQEVSVLRNRVPASFFAILHLGRSSSIFIFIFFFPLSSKREFSSSLDFISFSSSSFLTTSSSEVLNLIIKTRGQNKFVIKIYIDIYIQRVEEEIIGCNI